MKNDILLSVLNFLIRFSIRKTSGESGHSNVNNKLEFNDHYTFRPKKKAMFPPYRPGETFFLLTRAREKSTIPFFPFTLKFLFYFLRYSH